MGGVLKIFPHRDVDMWGCVCMSRFRRAWSSLNFYSLCNFRDLIYAQTACNTPKRKENLKSHMTPLSKVFVNKILHISVVVGGIGGEMCIENNFMM